MEFTELSPKEMPNYKAVHAQKRLHLDGSPATQFSNIVIPIQKVYFSLPSSKALFSGYPQRCVCVCVSIEVGEEGPIPPRFPILLDMSHEKG